MSTATAPRSRTRRQDQLELSAVELCRVHDAWAAAPNRRNPDEEYWEAVDALQQSYEVGDVPDALRPLADAVKRFLGEVEVFDNRDNDGRLYPHDEFWAARAGIAKVLSDAGDVLKPLEPMTFLRQQGSTDDQIAAIYGLKDANGNPLGHLIQQEIDKPGSVIGPDWVDPRLKERASRIQATETRANTLAAKQPAPKVRCKESPEDLWKDEVSIAQASRMLLMTEPEVAVLWQQFDKAKKSASGGSTSEAELETKPAAETKKPEGGSRRRKALPATSPPADPEPEVVSEVLDHATLVVKVGELFEGGTPAEEIAKQLDVELSEVEEILTDSQ